MTSPPSLSLSLTAEQLDALYPVPSWATHATGSAMQNNRDGWELDGDGYIRNLFWEGEYCSIGLGESCGLDGTYLEISQPVFTTLSDRNGEHENQTKGLLHVVTQYAAEIHKALTVVPEILAYTERMSALTTAE